MQTLIIFRNSLGISQRQLAAFIGGDRTQLVRAEKGERNLSADAAINFTALIPAWQAAIKKEVPQGSSHSFDEVTLEWKWKATQCRKNAQALQQQLSAMSGLYESAFRLQQFVLEINKSDLSLNNRQQRWLEQRQYEAQAIMTKTQACYQKSIRLQIQALETEAAMYENAICDLYNKV